MTRWGMLAAVAAAGALLLAAFVAPTGSAVAVVAALSVALLLTAVAGALLLRARATARSAVSPPPALHGDTLRRGALPPPPVRPARSFPSREVVIPPAPPDDLRIPSAGLRVPENVPAPFAPPQRVVAVARQLAQLAVQRTGAPAASVLIRHGRRLVAAGTAGDWALARQLQAEMQEDAPGWPAHAENVATPDADDPPTFPIDDTMPLMLALYGRAAPVERWHELEDAPMEVLPLAGLADRGAGVVVPLTHARDLAGLWVLARRPKGRSYNDLELAMLERLARQGGPALAAALGAPDA